MARATVSDGYAVTSTAEASVPLRATRTAWARIRENERPADLRPLIYRLDPRAKLACLALYTVLALTYFDPLINFALFLVVPILWAHARLSGSKARNLLISSLVYAAIIFVSQILLVPQKIAASSQVVDPQVLLSLPFLQVSDVSLAFAATITMRMCNPLLVAVIVILTSDPMQIVRALSKMGLPASVILVVASTFRLMPLAYEEMGNIQQAQRVRGLKAGKLGRMRSAVVPWLVNLMRMAKSIGLAVESKGFASRPARAALYRDPRMGRADYVAIGLCTLIVVAGLVLRFAFGVGATSLAGFY